MCLGRIKGASAALRCLVVAALSTYPGMRVCAERLPAPKLQVCHLLLSCCATLGAQRCYDEDTYIVMSLLGISRVHFQGQPHTLPQVTPMQISAGWKQISAGWYESQPTKGLWLQAWLAVEESTGVTFQRTFEIMLSAEQSKKSLQIFFFACLCSTENRSMSRVSVSWPSFWTNLLNRLSSITWAGS
jgi:hypothetical protein